MHPANLAFAFHLVVEVPASLSFLMHPHKQLREPSPSPDVVLLCQSYAGLLHATNTICFLFLCFKGGHFDDASAIVAGSLALYHVMPVRRAWLRIKRQQQQPSSKGAWRQQADAMGGPYVHLVMHCPLLVSLAWACLHGKSMSSPSRL